MDMVTEYFGRIPFSRKEGLPEGFETTPLAGLGALLPGPSLIHIEGKKEPPLFVSVLLHGNETSGFLALQQVLKPFAGTKNKPARSIFLFIGNVAASVKNRRRFAHEPDYNRIWNGGKLPEQRMAQRVLELMKKNGVFACIDIHNNTGRNPHYGCINRITPEFVNLALLFSPTIVYFTEPHEVISKAFSRFCTSVTVECGLSGREEGTRHLVFFLEQCLGLEAIPVTPPEKPYSLYHTTAKISLRNDVPFSFGKPEGNNGITLVDNLDRLNFLQLEPGTLLGSTQLEESGIVATNNSNHDVTSRYLDFENGKILTARRFTPSMFTKNKTVIRQDCLGYIMEHYHPGSLGTS